MDKFVTKCYLLRNYFVTSGFESQEQIEKTR